MNTKRRLRAGVGRGLAVGMVTAVGTMVAIVPATAAGRPTLDPESIRACEIQPGEQTLTSERRFGQIPKEDFIFVDNDLDGYGKAYREFHIDGELIDAYVDPFVRPGDYGWVKKWGPSSVGHTYTLTWYAVDKKGSKVGTHPLCGYTNIYTGP